MNQGALQPQSPYGVSIFRATPLLNTTVDYILNCSVPQGSVLGPQQFSAYTSEIPSVFKLHSSVSPVCQRQASVCMYASGRVSDVDDIRRR